jgi:hypothetical protein
MPVGSTDDFIPAAGEHRGFFSTDMPKTVI